MKKSSKQQPEEGFLTKVGHKIGEMTEAVVEKYNEIVHPDTKKAVKKAAPKKAAKKVAAKKPVAVKAPAKKVSAPKQAVAKKAAPKAGPAKKAAPAKKAK